MFKLQAYEAFVMKCKTAYNLFFSTETWKIALLQAQIFKEIKKSSSAGPH